MGGRGKQIMRDGKKEKKMKKRRKENKERKEEGYEAENVDCADIFLVFNFAFGSPPPPTPSLCP